MQARIQKALAKRQAGEGGFTLIELLVVIVIIGILAAIAIPAFLNQREKAWQKAVESDLRNLAMQIETDGVNATGAFEQGLVDTVEGAFTPSAGVDITDVVVTDGTSFTITGTHDNLDDSLTYDSANGGLQEWP